MQHADAEEVVFINTKDGTNNLEVNLERLEGKTLNDFTI
jgi:hypothetical protein